MVGMSSQERWFKAAKNVFLTGAGFTKKFGGYLASEMWALVLIFWITSKLLRIGQDHSYCRWGMTLMTLMTVFSLTS